MRLEPKQEKKLVSLLTNLNRRCQDNEKVKPIIQVFKCGTVEIAFQLYYKDTALALGDYAEIMNFIEEYETNENRSKKEK